MIPMLQVSHFMRNKFFDFSHFKLNNAPIKL